MHGLAYTRCDYRGLDLEGAVSLVARARHAIGQAAVWKGGGGGLGLMKVGRVDREKE